MTESRANQSSPTPGPIAAHRCFATVELPFHLPYSADNRKDLESVAPVDVRRRVGEFAPASFLAASLAANAPLSSAETRRGDSQGTQHRRTSRQPFTSGVATTQTLPDATSPASTHTFSISDPHLYTEDSVNSGWVALTCGAENSNPSVGPASSDARAALRIGNSSSAFPSYTPQMFLDSYHRNDLLVRLAVPQTPHRMIRRRRYRDGRVVEEEIPQPLLRSLANTRGLIGIPTGDSSTRPPAAASSKITIEEPQVMGVISKAIRIGRPVDFAFPPCTRSEAEQYPELCATNLFPPAHYLGERAVWGVPGYDYSPQRGKAVPGNGDIDGEDSSQNTVVLPNGMRGIYVSGASSRPAVDSPNYHASLTVDAQSDNIPPAATPDQQHILDEMIVKTSATPGSDGNTLTSNKEGRSPVYCMEVQTMTALLAERPMWVTHELLYAMRQKRECSRDHTNKKVMTALTYVIRHGPFNRLRVRMGYNPYSDPHSACLQRFAVRIRRVDELGTVVRDLSRIPRIRQRLQALNLPSSAGEEGTTAGSLRYPRRGSLQSLLVNIVSRGQLTFSFQLLDVTDDPVIAALVAQTVAEGYEKEKRQQRGGTDAARNRTANPRGWFSQRSYERLASHILETLRTSITTLIIPALQRQQEEEDWVGEGGQQGRQGQQDDGLQHNSLLDRDDRSDNSSNNSSGGVVSDDDDDNLYEDESEFDDDVLQE